MFSKCFASMIFLFHKYSKLIETQVRTFFAYYLVFNSNNFNKLTRFKIPYPFSRSSFGWRRRRDWWFLFLFLFFFSWVRPFHCDLCPTVEGLLPSRRSMGDRFRRSIWRVARSRSSWVYHVPGNQTNWNPSNHRWYSLIAVTPQAVRSNARLTLPPTAWRTAPW